MERDQEPPEKRYSIRAVRRVCRILDLIQEHPGGFSLNQVADVTELPKSSAYRYLTTLEDEGYIMRDPDTGLFRMGSAFVTLQSQQLELLADRVRPYLMRLREEWDETANLGILDGFRVAYLDIVESPFGVRMAPRRGEREFLHCTALGKAIAAELDEERVAVILEVEGMPARTGSTITTLEEYMNELEKVRAQGYAVDNCENEYDGRCVAVSLAGLGVPAAISLAAPSIRLSPKAVPRVAKALHECVEELMSKRRKTTTSE